MSTKQLDKAGWGTYFDRLSKVLPQAEAEIRVSSLPLGSQVEAEWLRLNGITYDHKDDIVVVSLAGIEHIIHSPKQAFAEIENGVLRGVEIIDAEGVKCLVQFRQPLALSEPAQTEDIVDEAGEESFPASDPPAWTGS